MAALSPYAMFTEFAAVHASVCNHFNQERALYSTRSNFKLKPKLLLPSGATVRGTKGQSIVLSETGSNSSDSTSTGISYIVTL